MGNGKQNASALPKRFWKVVQTSEDNTAAVNLQCHCLKSWHFSLYYWFVHTNGWIKLKLKWLIITESILLRLRRGVNKKTWILREWPLKGIFSHNTIVSTMLPLKQTDQAVNSRTKLFTTIPRAMITDKTSLRRFRVKGRWGIET